MPIQLIENFELSVPKPIDNRIVVGPGFTYTNKSLVPLPYVGMRIYDTNDDYLYVWMGSTWSFETQRIDIKHDVTSTSNHFISFISATGSPQQVKTNQSLIFKPNRGQIIAAEGSSLYPTYGFTSSSGGHMGMWKSSGNTLGFSIDKFTGTDFQISTLGITASQRFSVAYNSSTTTFGDGAVRYGRLSGVSPNFEFFTGSPNSRFSIYNLAPTPCVGGYSNTTVATTPLQFDNYSNYSEYKVRDLHYVNTESSRGVISIGTGNQFLFYMNGHTTATTGGLIDYNNGGGLYISSNLSVGGSARITGNLSTSYILAEGSSPGDYFGLGIRNTNNSNSASKISALSFWGRSTTDINQRVVDIYAQVRGAGADQGNWTKSSLVMSVVPRNLTGGTINYSGVTGWNTHTIEIREDGQVYMGPNQGAGSNLAFMPNGASPTSIFSGSPFFPNALPRLEVLAGLGEGPISQCIVLRHNTGPIASTRRLGMLMKLSNEGSLGESSKMGGMMVESVDSYSNYTGLFFLTENKKRIQVDHQGNIGLGNVSELSTWNRNNIASLSSLFISQSNGQCQFTNGSYAAPAISFINSTNTGFNFDQTNNRIGMNLGGVIRLRIGANDIFADIHNKGTGGIGDSGNDGNPWNFPTLASGTYIPVASDPTNCTVTVVSGRPAAWMRVGNVVTVSGRVQLSVDVAGQPTSFRLTLPINSRFGSDSSSPGANDWQLNGVGKLVQQTSNSSVTYNNGDVASIEALGQSGGGPNNFAFFRIKSTYIGACYITYTYQYIIGSWMDVTPPPPPAPPPPAV